LPGSFRMPVEQVCRGDARRRRAEELRTVTL
jgi:hypothetical protein